MSCVDAGSGRPLWHADRNVAGRRPAWSATTLVTRDNAFYPLLQTATTLWQRMLLAIGTHRVGQRPNRLKPHAVKRRPKPHRLLSLPCEEAERQLLLGTYN